MKKTIRKQVRKLTLDKETLRQIVLGSGPGVVVGAETVNVSQCPQYCTNVIDQCPITA